MKKLRIGRRRGRGDELALSPLELALYPALSDARWQIPDRFNFARDVVEAMSDDPKRRAVTFIGKDGIIEPRTFHQIAERAARWSWLLRERGVRPGDSVLVLAGTNVDWLEVVLACLKVGAVVVPGSPDVTAETLDVRVERTGAELIVAEPSVEPEIARMVERPLVLYVDEGGGLLDTVAEQAPTHDSSARDIAFVLSTAGTTGVSKLVGHSHGSVFAARVAAEHWLDAGRGDAIWAPADPGSVTSILYALVGPWSRGAETLLHDGPFEPLERLDLIYRLGVTVLCQSPAEYAALAELREVTRFQPPQLRRLVSTGDVLDPEVSRVFEEAWGLTIHDGYGQAETGVVLANSGEAGFRPGSLGYPLPGHLVAVIDDQGNELPPGVEGELAVRGRPPTLFAGYWESPEETKQAFRGDWYATGDLATVDEEGFFWFVGRGADMITSRGARFGPYETERALRALAPVAAAAVVGVRDLERGGQFLRAFVVPAAGAKTSEQLEAELRHEVAESLPDHAVPREIEFVDELPAVAGGKLRRVELRERLVVGRPLWDMPPTTEADDGPDLWAGMLAPWPAEAETPAAAPAVDASTGETLPDYIVPPVPVPEPEPAPEPEPVLEAVPDPEPEPAPPAPVAEVLAAPIPVPKIAPEPVLEPLPDYVLEPRTEPVAEPEAPGAEAAPTLEPEAVAPEPVAEPVALAPQPVADPIVERVAEQVAEPVVDEAPAAAVEEPAAPLRPLPDPVAPVRPPEWSVPLPNWGAQPKDDNVAPAEPEHIAEFEPVVENAVEDAAAEPEANPPTLEALTAMPEPEQEPESAFEPEPEPEPEPPALEAIPAPEPEPEVDPEPEPKANVWTPRPSLEPTRELEPEPEPEVDPEPEPKANVWTPRPSLEPARELEPERPDSVWTPVPAEPEPEHAEPEHLVEPEPAPEPEQTAGPTAGPEQPVSADDLIVEPQEGHARPPVPELPAPPPGELLDEEPADHGPLPDYIVDPEKPEDEPSRPIVRADSHAEAWPSATFPEIPVERVEPEPRLENLGLPPLSEFPGITRDPAERPAAPAARLDRPPEAQTRPTPQPKRRGRRAKAAEPGDEVDANAWMDGLSSRLSAYSLTGEEEAADGEPDDESAERGDAPDEQPSD